MHAWARGGLADGCSVVGVVFAGLALKAIGRYSMACDDASLQSQPNKMASPVMGARTGFHGYHAASWELGTPGEKLVARQRPAHDWPALRIDCMNLDNVLCKIDANSCNLFHGTSPFKGFRLTFTPQSWHSMPSPEGGKSLRIPIVALRCRSPQLRDYFGSGKSTWPRIRFPTGDEHE
jgi:hypothetical protein